MIDDLPRTLWGKLVLRYDLFRYDLSTVPDKFRMWLAWRMPRRLVMWAAIRLMSHATTGKYGREEPDSVSIMTALKRWDHVNE